MKHREPRKCPLCQHHRRANEFVHPEFIRSGISDLIRAAHPAWDPLQPICLTCVNGFRARLVQQILENEKGDLSRLEQQVVESLSQQTSVATDLNSELEAKKTVGERWADAIAEFGGSWRFISIFMIVLLVWMVINSSWLSRGPFDPFPFILLNLVLSCLAALQAPIIMMSQHRQESRDRLRAEHDYRVNLKAELEIRQLHAKLDELLSHQWQHLMELQQIQIEIMNELSHLR